MDAIQLLKTIHSATTEDLFDIFKQPGQKCPLVDAALSDLKYISDECAYQERRIKHNEDIDDVKDAFNDLVWVVQSKTDINDRLEDLRKACSDLRDWGQEWKSLALILLKKHGHEEYIADKFANTKAMTDKTYIISKQ